MGDVGQVLFLAIQGRCLPLHKENKLKPNNHFFNQFSVNACATEI